MGSYMLSKKMMEINLDNFIMKELCKCVDVDKGDKIVKDLVFFVFEIAMFIFGFFLDESTTFGGCIYCMIKFGFFIDEDDVLVVDDLFVFEEEVDEGFCMEEVD